MGWGANSIGWGADSMGWGADSMGWERDSMAWERDWRGAGGVSTTSAGATGGSPTEPLRAPDA